MPKSDDFQITISLLLNLAPQYIMMHQIKDKGSCNAVYSKTVFYTVSVNYIWQLHENRQNCVKAEKSNFFHFHGNKTSELLYILSLHVSKKDKIICKVSPYYNWSFGRIQARSKWFNICLSCTKCLQRLLFTIMQFQFLWINTVLASKDM